jgi:hydroxymethylglutaryl-CoA reductase (NADPH)
MTTTDSAQTRVLSLEEERELVAEIAAGGRSLHQLPADLDPVVAARVRRRGVAARAVETSRGSDAPGVGEPRRLELEHVGHFSFDVARASRQNCENLIGVAQVPMGVVGPLRVRGDELDGEVFVPLATTEGALVASVNRGARAIHRAGGARVWVEEVGMTRAPAFATSGIDEARRLIDWMRENEEEVRAVAEASSRFTRLVEVRPAIIGTTVLLRFRFATGDAMGMNMATIACDRVVRELIEPRTGVRCVALSGNFCVDKKASAVNFLLGRGKRIMAEVVLPEEVVSGVLKSSASALVEVQTRKNLHGSIAAGAMGYNAQFANVLAALFVACGQDLAHVSEASIGVTSIEERPGGAVHASVTLPDVPLAAVGGGTALDTQREALELMGVRADPARPGAAVRRLGEIAGAVVLAGELSLMAAFTSQDLARAHERLGRAKG